MAQLRIYNEICDEETKVLLSDWYGTDGVCYKDIIEFLDSMDEEDNNIDILIHCPGGSCVERWAIYDKQQSKESVLLWLQSFCSQHLPRDVSDFPTQGCASTTRL